MNSNSRQNSEGSYLEFNKLLIWLIGLYIINKYLIAQVLFIWIIIIRKNLIWVEKIVF